MISDDEENELESNSFDDSFIDDRINPTAANTQAEGNRVDMMGVYRFFINLPLLVSNVSYSILPLPQYHSAIF